MIHTKEPANMFYVYVSAARANLSDIVNMGRQTRLKGELLADPEYYGTLECTGLTGCYREEGQEAVSTERTYRVLCNRAQAINVARLACNQLEQDCVLAVRSQTHIASLVNCKGSNPIEWTNTALEGTFQQVAKPTGECYTVDANGLIWEVI